MARSVGWVEGKSGKPADGSWRVRVSYKDQSGAKKWRSATIRADGHGGKRAARQVADRLAIRIEDEIAAAKFDVKPETMRVSELASRWLEATADRRSKVAQENEQHRVRDYVVPPIGNVHISELQAAHVVRVMDGTVVGKSGRPLAAATRKHVHTCMVGMFGWGVRQGWMVRSPTDLVDPPRKGFVPRTVIPAASHGLVVDAVRRMNPNAPGSATEWFMSISTRLALATGARQAELVGFRWSDWDETNGLLMVERSITRDGDVRAGGKSGRVRYAAVGAGLAADLDRWRTILGTHAATLGITDPDDSTPIVTWTAAYGPVRWRGHVRPQILSRWWSANRVEIARQVGDPTVAKVVFHGLRHSFVTALIEAGVSPSDVGSVVGHGAVETTRGYHRDGQSGAKRVANAVDKLEEDS